MSISGNLATMELSELLQWVGQGNRTGTLVIESDSSRKDIYFDEGKIVATGSTDESEQLGHFLVSHGYVTEPELDKAVAIQEETGMLLGKILVTIGGISEDELLDLLVTKTEETVYNLFTWEEGEFRFVEDQTLDRGMIPMALDVTALTLQGMNRLDEWSRIRKLIPSAHAVPVLVADADPDQHTAADRRILAAVDDRRSVGDICRHARCSEFQVSKLLHDEHREGRVKIVVPRERVVEVEAEAPAPTQEPASEAEEEPPARAVIDGEALCERGMELLEKQDLDRGLRHLRAARVLEPHRTSVRETVRKGEDIVREHLRSKGLDSSRIPVLERDLEELTDLELSPEQGFLLTRIDGSSTIASLLKLTPLEPLDAELVFFKFLERGHVRLRPRDD